MAAAIRARIAARGWPSSDEVCFARPSHVLHHAGQHDASQCARAQSLHPLVAEVWKASERLAGSGVLVTPLLDSRWLAAADNGAQRHRPQTVLLKLENRQVTGSFKARGATNKVQLLFCCFSLQSQGARPPALVFPEWHCRRDATRAAGLCRLPH